jgi:glycosyltransferase involved in cell wall biosynthesis
MPPLVSIIVPTYNRAALLRETITSVLAQTYPAIELIVVDDGSTDATPELLASYGDRIRVIRKQNGGGTAARNTGLAAARGAYVSFLDHDDLLLPEKIARQVALLERRPELGAVHCRWYFIDREGARIDTIGMLPAGDLLAPLTLGCFIWSGGPLIRRSVLAEVGGFDPAIWSSDWDMWLRIARAGHHFGCVQEPLGCYRILADSTMADVARTERSDAAIFSKLFADPRLPPDVAALEPEALANWRFWLSRRYYAIGAWEDARRNFALALRLRPALLADRQELRRTLVNEALDVRVADAVGYSEGVLAHLPVEAAALAADASALRSLVLAGQGLRRIARGEEAAGQRDLRAALALRPGVLDEPEEFRRLAHGWAMRLHVAPERYLAAICDGLPAEAHGLRRLRGRLAGDIRVGRAFELYAAGQRRRAAWQMAGAVCRRPAYLRNRGVLAVLARGVRPELRAEG